MLVLGRKPGESIQIESNIRVVVVSAANGRVKLGIDAPDHVRILRAELRDCAAANVGNDQAEFMTRDGATLVAPR